eukprot:CAMPEP_0114641868 /NCGR_PEP_ID=MMETSP0191-20121206/2503_1 /TAXON_ID=126664 /ORGANISM="Sorites sp." /LENGTH=181 /DNA_ID=CAMNT_0001853971 /DNA_START=161 /DNA_END=702 /DNA_ORIENTATION=-
MTGACEISSGSAKKVRTSMVGMAAASNNCSAAARLSDAAAKMACAAAAVLGLERGSQSSLSVCAVSSSTASTAGGTLLSVEPSRSSMLDVYLACASAASALAFMTANAALYMGEGSIIPGFEISVGFSTWLTSDLLSVAFWTFTPCEAALASGQWVGPWALTSVGVLPFWSLELFVRLSLP